jgi:hypothetical protein
LSILKKQAKMCWVVIWAEQLISPRAYPSSITADPGWYAGLREASTVRGLALGSCKQYWFWHEANLFWVESDTPITLLIPSRDKSHSLIVLFF